MNKELQGPVWPEELPAFEVGYSNGNKHRFVWWSWNPWYPYWSQSCWGADTEREAWKQLEIRAACKMRQYHNKLIRLQDGHHTGVADLPPSESLKDWLKAVAQRTPATA